MRILRIQVAIALVLSAAVSVFGETLRFRYKEDGKYRVKSRVDEEVFIDGAYQYTTEILNKIAYTVTDIEGDWAALDAVFQTSEKADNGDDRYELDIDYVSRFRRDHLGNYDIAEEYFMPVVRRVPIFPEEDIEPGTFWVAEGEEVHDFRQGMGIEKAYHFPIEVDYYYVGPVLSNDTTYHKIEIQYEVLHRPEPVESTSGVYPVQISGYSWQNLYWDNVNGHAYRYDEEFDFQFFMNNGVSFRFRGFAEAEMIESPVMDREEVAAEIEQALEEQGIDNTAVKVVDEGVMISIENIQFLPDSDILVLSEKAKLDTIAGILKGHMERDIMIVGHTAMAGTAEGRQILSEERAVAVGMYLMERGALTADRMIIRGMGGRAPIADNLTDEGMRRNRRVEITILEN